MLRWCPLNFISLDAVRLYDISKSPSKHLIITAVIYKLGFFFLLHEEVKITLKVALRCSFSCDSAPHTFILINYDVQAKLSLQYILFFCASKVFFFPQENIVKDDVICKTTSQSGPAYRPLSPADTSWWQIRRPLFYRSCDRGQGLLLDRSASRQQVQFRGQALSTWQPSLVIQTTGVFFLQTNVSQNIDVHMKKLRILRLRK